MYGVPRPMNDRTFPFGPVPTDPNIAAVSTAIAAERQRRPRSHRFGRR
jgi:hypothetical protein